jgi:hypothetical protein
VVVDEEFVGTLLEANEKIVEAIQLFDKVGTTSADLVGSPQTSASSHFG